MTVKFISGTELNKFSIDSTDENVYISDHYDVKLLDCLKKQYPHVFILQNFFFVYPQGFDPVLYVPKVLIKENYGDRRVSGEVETKGCFNFMIYKIRSTRNLAMTKIEEKNLFTDYYTLNSKPPEQSPYRTPSKVFAITQSSYSNENWNDFLDKNVFEPTAVSLITEALELEWGACMTFTEKTVYSVLGLNFPIWLGGYQQAVSWEKLGFDSFDNVINHDYQYQTDPALSMEQALSDNDKILRDLEYAAYIRKNMLPRLMHNRQKFLNHSFQKQISQILQNECPDRAVDIEKFLNHCYPC